MCVDRSLRLAFQHVKIHSIRSVPFFFGVGDFGAMCSCSGVDALRCGPGGCAVNVVAMCGGRCVDTTIEKAQVRDGATEQAHNAIAAAEGSYRQSFGTGSEFPTPRTSGSGCTTEGWR